MHYFYFHLSVDCYIDNKNYFFLDPVHDFQRNFGTSIICAEETSLTLRKCSLKKMYVRVHVHIEWNDYDGTDRTGLGQKYL